MMEFLEAVERVFSTFGGPIFVPVILFIIALAFGVKLKKAFFSALYAGIGLTGFNLIIGSYVPVMVGAVQDMVKNSGVDLPVLDIGWQATSVVAYATRAGMIFLVLGLLFQLLLYLIKWTDVFQPSDLWNNYSYMVWGSMIYLITENMGLALTAMFVLNLYSLLFSEMLAERWSKYYNYPNCTIIQLHHVGVVPFAIVMNWILNKLGANKIKITPKGLQDKLGFMGQPIVLGLFLGALIGVLGNLGSLGALASWGQIATIAISTSAVMAIFPKVAGIFAQAFSPLTEATKKTVKKDSKAGKRDIYLGVNDAVGYGEEATLISGILLIPIMFGLAVILPGNDVLPLVDLIALPFMVEGFVAIMNGNIFKVVVSGSIWFSMGLYVATYTAPMFTRVAESVGVSIPEGALQITSFGILTKPIAGLIFLAFMKEFWIAIGAIIVLYFGAYFLFRKNKVKFRSFLENQALEENE